MENIQEQLALIPHEPGVYLYKDSKHQVIYVGKAKDLLKRVRQYFQKDNTLGEKTSRLVSEIVSIETIPTTNEFDALILEAKLIHTYLPKYNVMSRDDKSPLYVVMTLSEDLPKILLARKGDLPVFKQKKKNKIYGPFQSAFTLRTILRQLRSIVPYCTQKERRGKRCFYTQLGLCDPCPAEIITMTGDQKIKETLRYRRNIVRLSALFEGKTYWLVHQYEKEMHDLAQQMRFEEAAVIRKRNDHLNALSSYRYDPEIYLDFGAEDVYEQELEELKIALLPYYPDLASLHRIEAFDISNLMGDFAVGSMVVLIDGKPDKKEYRKFRIRNVHGISDIAMMKEVLKRRLAHGEWHTADFMLIDGGKPQVSAARTLVSRPFAGLAKREETLIIPSENGKFVGLQLPLSGKAIKVLQRIRDEAHRYAIAYHRHLRDKIMINTQ